MPDSLRFCYDVAIEGTPLNGSELKIIRTPGHSRCRDCGQKVEMHDMLACCTCGSVNLDPPQGGDELKIKSMEIVPLAGPLEEAI
jgi:hydrogenase nickel incorporation protein HypA/HybF